MGGGVGGFAAAEADDLDPISLAELAEGGAEAVATAGEDDFLHDAAYPSGPGLATKACVDKYCKAGGSGLKARIVLAKADAGIGLFR
jgi:hypothetical protein